MSRKDRSFSNLYDYLTRDSENYSFTKNTYSHSKDKENLINEFIQNSEYLDQARGKNYMYHELLSLEENNLSLERQKEILLDLANKYLNARAKNHLSFGVIHEDKNNIHLHLMISANEVEGQKRIRLSKKEFSLIQKHLENFKNEKFKELSKTKIYQKQKDLSKDKQNEQELKHKRNKKSTKDQIKEDLENSFKKATSRSYLKNHLKNLGYEIYERGQTIGVMYNNKKYRLKTLGIDLEYKHLLNKFLKIEQRRERRGKTRES